jgi:hypothetical protein
MVAVFHSIGPATMMMTVMMAQMKSTALIPQHPTRLHAVPIRLRVTTAAASRRGGAVMARMTVVMAAMSEAAMEPSRVPDSTDAQMSQNAFSRGKCVMDK